MYCETLKLVSSENVHRFANLMKIGVIFRLYYKPCKLQVIMKMWNGRKSKAIKEVQLTIFHNLILFDSKLHQN